MKRNKFLKFTMGFLAIPAIFLIALILANVAIFVFSYWISWVLLGLLICSGVGFLFMDDNF